MSAIPNIRGPVLFRMLADSGDACEIRGYDHPVVHDLSTLEIPGGLVPVVFRHEPTLRLGHATKIQVVGGRLVGCGTIENSFDNLLAKNVLHSLWSGALWQVSTDTRANILQFVPSGKSERVNGRRFVGPVLIAREPRLKNLSIAEPGGAAVKESSVLVEGSLGWELFGGGEFTPTQSELLKVLIARERCDQEIERDRKRFREQMDMECRERAQELWVAEINAREIRRGEHRKAMYIRDREARKLAAIEAAETAKHEEWLNRGGMIARKIREACGRN